MQPTLKLIKAKRASIVKKHPQSKPPLPRGRSGSTQLSYAPVNRQQGKPKQLKLAIPLEHFLPDDTPSITGKFSTYEGESPKIGSRKPSPMISPVKQPKLIKMDKMTARSSQDGLLFNTAANTPSKFCPCDQENSEKLLKMNTAKVALTEGGNEFTPCLAIDRKESFMNHWRKASSWQVDIDGGFKSFWETSKFILLLYTLIYLPFKASFLDFEDPNIYFYALDKIIDAIFAIDIVLIFLTPIYVDHELVNAPKTIALNYVKGWLFFDLISVLPIEEIIGVWNGRFKAVGHITKSLRLLRLLKLVRLFKAFDFTNADNYIVRVLNTRYKGTVLSLLLPNFLVTAFSFHCLTCLWYVMGTSATDLENWIDENHFRDRPVSFMYVSSCYFVVTTSTSCGYGDIISTSPSELMFKIAVMIIGALEYAIFTGRIVEYRSQRMEQDELKQRKINSLRGIVSYVTDLSPEFCMHCEQSIMERPEISQRKYDFSSLTPEEEQLFHYYKYIGKYKQIKLFARSADDKEFVIKLGDALEKKKYLAEEVIFKAGDAAEHFFLLAKGEVGVGFEKLDLIPVMKISSGYFGEVELITRTYRSYTYTALTDCTVYRIGARVFEELFMQRDEYLRNAMIRKAEIRTKEVQQLQQNFDFFLRTKIFWRIVLRGHRKRKDINKVLNIEKK